MADSQATPSESSTRLHQVAAALVATAAIVAVLVAVFTSGSTSELGPGKPVPGSASTISMLRGVPQEGIALGRSDAPVTLAEYGDLQCPSCASFATEELPGLVSTYVRRGELRILYRPLDLIGSDSLRAARMALALAAQDRLWQFIALMYRNQGAENTGFVTDTYLRALASVIPGTDVSRALAQRGSASVNAQVARFAAEAHRLRLAATPSFTIARTGGRSEVLPAAAAVDQSAIEEAVERLLRR